MKLTIELVPKTTWYKNLRSMLPTKDWDKLRKVTYQRVKYKCEICGGQGKRHPVECHEKWEYDDKNYIAKLVGLLGLCPSCHECKHPGLAEINGRLPNVIKHLSKINKISTLKAEKMINEAFKVWEKRSEHNYKVDISWATNNKKET